MNLSYLSSTTIAVLLCFNICIAQEKFEQLTVKNGLSQSTIKSIHQDSKGYLWFGTGDGLNKYDGFNITKFFYDPIKPNSLVGDNISFIYENPYDTTLWIGTENSGISLYEKKKNDFTSIDKSKPLNNIKFLRNIRAMVATDNESLWIASYGNGIYCYNPKNSTFSFPKFSNRFKIDNINCLELDSNGCLWIGTTRGLYFWNPNSSDKTVDPKQILLNDEQTNLQISCLKFDIKGHLFVGTRKKGLIKYHPKSKRKIYYSKTTAKFSLPTNEITALLVTKKGNLWVGTSNGLCKFIKEKNQFKTFRNTPLNKNSLSGNRIASLYEDRAGIIWIGTFYSGVNKLDPNRNKFPIYTDFFQSKESDPDPINIMSMCLDNDNSLWMNTSKGLLEVKSSYFSNNTDKPGSIKNFNQKINGSIFFNKQYGLFIGLKKNGVNRMSSNGFLEQLSPIILKQTGKRIGLFNTAITDSDGIIWFSIPGGLLKYNASKKIFKFVKIKISEKQIKPTSINKIIENFEGHFFMSTRNGVILKFDRHLETIEQKITFKDTNDSNYYPRINVLHESNSGNLFLGTNNGLYYYKTENNELKQIIDPEKVLNTEIYGILEDKQGKIWCSSNNGIITYTSKTQTFQNFSHLDGLQSKEFNEEAYTQSEDGTFYMGGIYGLNVFRPENIQPSSFITPVVINRMEIMYEPISHETHPEILNKQLSETKKITLSHEKSTFIFEYIGLSYSLPFRNKYKYILEGFDSKWVNAGSRRIASYTNVPPGNYTFKVKASNSDGIWNESPTTLQINITPPYWKTIWFRLLIGLLLFSIIYISTIQRIKRIKKQKIFLEKRVAEKTKSLIEQKLQIESQNHELIEINAQVKDKNKILNTQNNKINEQHKDLIKLTEEIKKVNQAKIQFFTTISHEFRTPLTLIITPLKDILRNSQDIGKLERQLKNIYSNASKLLILTNQLLGFRKMETKNMKLEISKIEIVSFIQQIAYLFNELASQKEITLNFTSSLPKITIWADSLKIEKILVNLLSNAFKNTFSGGKISMHVKVSPNKEQVIFSISDTGTGIEKEKIPFIFKRFFQNETTRGSKQEGSGLGLSITKSYVELHHGKIEVTSQVNLGTTFTLHFPKDKHKSLAHTSNNTSIISPSTEQYLASLDNYIPININAIETVKDRKKLELLIIEDNKDLGTYFKDILSMEYRITVVDTAEEGFLLASSTPPELIICDVMLPGISGFDFCKKIKSNVNMKHIPLILLTAMSDQENEITGLKHGADDYITKPFDLEHLLLKIKNLIELKQQLLAKSPKDLVFDPPEIEDKMDKVFIDRVIKSIEKNLSDPHFNVDRLIALTGQSHTHVYRKIHTLTDLSISEFIRNTRLKKAAQLLLTNEFQINEIAYKVGFTSPNYFSRCFTKLYEQTPTQFIKNSQR